MARVNLKKKAPKKKAVISRAEMVDLISNQLPLDYQKKEISAVMETLITEIKKAVKAGKSVTFKEFGTFTAIQRKARSGYNMNSKKVISIPARKEFVFHASKNLKFLKEA